MVEVKELEIGDVEFYVKEYKGKGLYLCGYRYGNVEVRLRKCKRINPRDTELDIILSILLCMGKVEEIVELFRTAGYSMRIEDYSIF